jgi:phenylalanyl-tRNA synthetase alpha subunit
MQIEFRASFRTRSSMAISFQSDEEVLSELRDRLRKMTEEELIRFGMEVRRLAKNPFQRQLEEARKEWKRSTYTETRAPTSFAIATSSQSQ